MSRSHRVLLVQGVILLSELSAVFAETIPRVLRISLLVSVAVYLANVAVAFGLVERIAGLSRLLTGPANLPDEVGTAILTTTASTTAGYAMLADLRESGYLDDTATLVAVTMNTFFGFVQHVFTFYIPVLIPILGLRVGVLYVGARALIALAITLVGILAGALLLSDRNVDPSIQLDPDALDEGDRSPRARLVAAWERTAPTIRRLIPRLIVVYTLVTLLIARVDVSAITGAADPLATLVGLPAASLPVIAVYTFDTTAGAATIAPLLGEVFTPRQAVATLLLGGIVSFAVSTFKRSIPFQYGIWGANFGSKVILVNTGLKLVFIGLTVVTLLAW
ncbi:nucleoside recognition protein [Haloferacaceae archaeon DSL9]